jgi:hypothetical protein
MKRNFENGNATILKQVEGIFRLRLTGGSPRRKVIRMVSIEHYGYGMKDDGMNMLSRKLSKPLSTDALYASLLPSLTVYPQYPIT